MKKLLFGTILALLAFLVMQAHAATAPTTNTTSLQSQLQTAEQTLAQIQALQTAKTVPAPAAPAKTTATLLAELQSAEATLSELQSLQAAQVAANTSKVKPVLENLSGTLATLQTKLAANKMATTDRTQVATTLNGIDKNLTALRTYVPSQVASPAASTEVGMQAIVSAQSSANDSAVGTPEAKPSSDQVAQGQKDQVATAETQTATISKISWRDSMPAIIAVLVVLGIILLARRGGKKSATSAKKQETVITKENNVSAAVATATPVMTQSQASTLDPKKKTA